MVQVCENSNRLLDAAKVFLEMNEREFICMETVSVCHPEKRDITIRQGVLFCEEIKSCPPACEFFSLPL